LFFQGLWLKATLNSDGNDFKAKALYAKYRLNQLKREMEEAHEIQQRVQSSTPYRKITL
jgi:hypothetical protein